MEINHVDGKKKGGVLLYALSTCVWCKKTKKLLNRIGVAYDYIDVDLLDKDEKEEIRQKVRRWNPRGSYPVIVIDETESIIGYDPDKINEVLGDG